MTIDRRWLAGGAALALLLGVGGYFAWTGWFSPPAKKAPDAAVDIVSTDQGLNAKSGDVVTVDDGQAQVVPGTTPMAERVAVLGFLNKRNGESREIKLKPGEATRIGNAIVRLRACEVTAPWEPEQYTGAFVQLDVVQTDNKVKRVFSGWLFKERPALNVVQDPVYDVWPKSCAMTIPDRGPDTVAASGASASGGGSKRSSAPKSAVDADGGKPTASPPAPSPSASPKSDT